MTAKEELQCLISWPFMFDYNCTHLTCNLLRPVCRKAIDNKKLLRRKTFQPLQTPLDVKLFIFGKNDY